MSKLSLPKPEQLLLFLKESVDEVFRTMLDTVAVLVESHWKIDGGIDTSNKVDIEAVVEFSGMQNGAVVLRCTAEGAMDIARNMLMLTESDVIDLDEIKDALGECANMVSGSLKAKALDRHGEFSLGTPKMEAYARDDTDQRCGLLVYRLSNGRVAVEVWMDPAGRPD